MSNNPIDIQLLGDDEIIYADITSNQLQSSNIPPIYYPTPTAPIPDIISTSDIPVPFIDIEDLQFVLYEQIAAIQDPEFSQTLEELAVVSDDGISLTGGTSSNALHVAVSFRPTVPHCSYASLIGLSIIYVLQKTLNTLNYTPSIYTTKNPSSFVKIKVTLPLDSHNTAEDLNKQFLDKDRVSAALESPIVMDQIERLLPQLENMH